MIRSRRPIKSTQQRKEEQINFLFEDTEKNIEQYKKSIALADNQIAEAKNTSGSKKKLCYNSVVKENQQLKEYIQNIKQRYEEHQLQQ